MFEIRIFFNIIFYKYSIFEDNSGFLNKDEILSNLDQLDLKGKDIEMLFTQSDQDNDDQISCEGKFKLVMKFFFFND